MPGIDMNHWTPSSVLVVLSGLISLIGAIVGGIVSVVHAIKGGQDIANNAVNAVRDSVPSSTVHAMINGNTATARTPVMTTQVNVEQPVAAATQEEKT